MEWDGSGYGGHLVISRKTCNVRSQVSPNNSSDITSALPIMNTNIINVYSGLTKEPVFSISIIEVAAKSPVIRNILNTLTFCDGCRDPISIIFPDDDSETVIQGMGQFAHFKKRGLSIIQGIICLLLAM